MPELPDDYRELQDIAKGLGIPATGTADELRDRILAANTPAREPYTDDEREREYVVTGPHPVLGHRPGSKFRAVIPPEQEARLIRRGQITRVDAIDDDNQTQEG